MWPWKGLDSALNPCGDTWGRRGLSHVTCTMKRWFILPIRTPRAPVGLSWTDPDTVHPLTLSGTLDGPCDPHPAEIPAGEGTASVLATLSSRLILLRGGSPTLAAPCIDPAGLENPCPGSISRHVRGNWSDKGTELVSRVLHVLGEGDPRLGRALRSNVHGGGKLPALPSQE